MMKEKTGPGDRLPPPARKEDLFLLTDSYLEMAHLLAWWDSCRIRMAEVDRDGMEQLVDAVLGYWVPGPRMDNPPIGYVPESMLMMDFTTLRKD